MRPCWPPAPRLTHKGLPPRSIVSSPPSPPSANTERMTITRYSVLTHLDTCAQLLTLPLAPATLSVEPHAPHIAIPSRVDADSTRSPAASIHTHNARRPVPGRGATVHGRRGFQPTAPVMRLHPPPQRFPSPSTGPLRGANIGCADIIGCAASPCRTRGRAFLPPSPSQGRGDTGPHGRNDGGGWGVGAPPGAGGSGRLR
jgi:hypothetical protein